MSKAAKQSIFILIVLLLASLGFAGYTLVEKQKVEQAKASAEQQLSSARSTNKKLEGDLKTVQTQLSQAVSARTELESRLKDAQSKASAINSQLEEVTADREKWKGRIDDLRKERNDLMEKLQAMVESQPQQPRAVAQSESSSSPAMASAEGQSAMAEVKPVTVGNDEYWASLVKEKTALEVKLQKLQSELSQKSVDLVDVKQKSDSLQMELDSLKHNVEGLERDVQFKEDMINNLSLELARTKNDKKFVADRVEKLNSENVELRKELKKVVTVKSSLEKSIMRLADEKSKIEGKLGQSEAIIQSKIDEIWEIKDSIDRTIRDSKIAPGAQQVELPPIVVNSNGQAVSFNDGAAVHGFNGKVVSVNKDNNFVIVDLGESSGVKLGDVISVYRDSKYIARLEVIQVRQDISAADIKEQWAEIKAGDIVK